MENHGYNQVSQSSTWQSISSKGLLLSNYYAITHPTQPNYIAVLGGSTLGVSSNGDVDLSSSNVADLLENKGKTWRYYGEDYYTSSGSTCNTKFQRRSQCPFLSFTSISYSSKRCANIYSESQLYTDIANNNLTEFGFWSPNNNHNGHNYGVSSAASTLSSFLNTWYWPYVKTTWKNTLFMVTWDEDAYCDGYDECNHIFSLLMNPCIKTGTSNVYFNHYSITRFIEDNYKLGYLGRGDADANNFAAVLENTCPVVPPWCDDPELGWTVEGDGVVYAPNGTALGTVLEDENGTMRAVYPDGQTVLCYVYPDDLADGTTPPSREIEGASAEPHHPTYTKGEKLLLGLALPLVAVILSSIVLAFLRSQRRNGPTENSLLLTGLKSDDPLPGV